MPNRGPGIDNPIYAWSPNSGRQRQRSQRHDIAPRHIIGAAVCGGRVAVQARYPATAELHGEIDNYLMMVICCPYRESS